MHRSDDRGARCRVISRRGVAARRAPATKVRAPGDPASNRAAGPVTLAPAPDMPIPQELFGILIAVLVIWILLKMARVAIRLILFVIVLLLVLGALYFFFMR